MTAQIYREIVFDGSARPVMREVAEETPVAIELNGINYAVLMATPQDLEDLAIGFILAERLLERGATPPEAECFAPETGGHIIRLQLPPSGADTLIHRVRHRTSDSSCGLCGIESLEQAIQPLPPVTSACAASDASLFRALANLRTHQPLNARTGAVHAAALCDAEGEVRLIREDVGRHNAFDKLIGAMARQGLGWDGGFALLTSRCSYELVEKAALAQCPLLATLSAPTSLALDRAAAAGLQLRVLVRPDSLLAPIAGSLPASR